MRFILVLAALLVLSNSAFAEDELSIRDGVQANVWSLLQHEKFGDLNKLEEQYRATGEKTPSGIFKLTLFYFGLYAQLEENDGTEMEWGDTFLKVHKWIQRNPSPAAHIALANLYIESAWRERGTGYANSVTPGQWKAFFSLTKLAHQELDENKTTASIDPEWYVSMVKVARAEQWPQKEAAALFTAATRKDRYYYPIYSQILESLLPQWGGSWLAIDNFANFAADNTKDREGEELYTRLYWNLEECGCESNNKLAGDWTKMKVGFRDILSRYPTDWNRNNFAYIACRENDKATLRLLLPQMPKPILAAWRGEANYGECKSWASKS